MSNKIVLYFIRHENRYPNGLADCSLTHDGIYSARHELPKIISAQPKIQNIYCSPLLRTCQTIYQYAKDNNHLIKLEQSLYEFVSGWTRHYSVLAQSVGVPQIKQDDEKVLCLYKNQYILLLKIKQKLEQWSDNESEKEKDNELKDTELISELKELKQDFDFLNIMMNDDHYTYMTKSRYHYDNKITKIIENITYCILLIDGLIIGKMPRINIPSEKKPNQILLNVVNESVRIIESYDIAKQIDKSYESVIQITDFLVGKENETISDAIHRTKYIVDLMMESPEYNNSIYVSHLDMINTLIVNVFNYVYNDSTRALQCLNEQFDLSCPSFEIFCGKHPVPIGSVHKIEIDKTKEQWVLTVELLKESMNPESVNL